MASKAILRRKRFVTGYVNTLSPSIQSFQFLGRGNDSSRGFYSTGDSLSTNDHADKISVKNEPLLGFTGIGQFVRGGCGVKNSAFGNTRSEFSHPSLGIRWMSHSIRNSSTAAAKQQELGGSDNEDNEELVANKRKEPSPEECDQAVEGLTTAKAKAKAKKLQDSHKAVNSVLQRVWSTFLGIGPALRAVASMSK